MAINNPILSVQKSSPRSRNRYVSVRQAPVIPPESYRVRTPDGPNGSELISQAPEKLGQMCYYRVEGTSRLTVMYVVVSVGGELVWKEVRSEVVFLDTNTGQPWDPLSRFYNTNYPGYSGR